MIPLEIRRRGPEAERIFRLALSEGRQKIPRCNLLVLGEERVGKTSLIRQLTGKHFISNLEPTCGIENTRVRTVEVATIATNDGNDWSTVSENDQAMQHLDLVCGGVAKKIEEQDPEFFNRKEKHLKVAQSTLPSEEQLLKRIQKLQKKFRPPIVSPSAAKISTVLAPKRGKIEHHTDIHRPDLVPRLVVPPQPLTSSSVPKESQSSRPAPVLQPERRGASTSSVTTNEISPSVLTPGTSEKKKKQSAPKQKSDSQITLTRRQSKDFSKRLKSRKDVEPTLVFNTLDFAGQKGYRPMHHCFISRGAIYIVVYNLTSLVQNHCVEKQKAIEELEYWLNSIHAHTKMHIDSVKQKASMNLQKYVFLVGTHKAEVTADQMDEINKKLQDQFSTKRFFDDIHMYEEKDNIFAAVENSFDKLSQRVDSGINGLKSELLKATKVLPFLEELRPISWLRFENALLQRRKQMDDASPPVMKLQDVTDIAKQCGMYVDQPNDVHIALQFFHDTGTIIYPSKHLVISLSRCSIHVCCRGSVFTLPQRGREETAR